uniref:Putative beta-neurotoxin RjAa10f n=1 Tax=Rhopalurus junceus TaxID=419285 RepID=SX10F_RHOJU|nr:RecName: Full=Putative beta-neurotoxin RjAa10f; Flags: Precursor [Rhopalurus junceus]ADV16830.1 venom toxin [Rhopalurus junceus]
MKILIFIIASFMLIGVWCKEGYPMGRDGCKIPCALNHKFCKTECQAKWKGSDGYCYSTGMSCYCTNLPENAEVWDPNNNKCVG